MIDLREVKAQAHMEEMEHRTWIGLCSNGFPISYLGPNQFKWTPSPFHDIKFNVDVAWNQGKASIVVLGRNHDGEVINLWYDNLECAFALAIDFLQLKKFVLFLLIFQ